MRAAKSIDARLNRIQTSALSELTPSSPAPLSIWIRSLQPFKSRPYRASAPTRRLLGAGCAALALGYTSAIAQADQPVAAPPGDAQAPASAPEKPSPWLFAPVFTSNPKLGTTLGATAGYLHLFDPKSRPSMFAATGQYSNTGSMVAGLFARTSFDADHQRLNVAASLRQHQERLRRLPRNRGSAAQRSRS